MGLFGNFHAAFCCFGGGEGLWWGCGMWMWRRTGRQIDAARGFAQLPGGRPSTPPDRGLGLRWLRPDWRGTGLILDRTEGAEVRNCMVSGFRNGIRVRGGSSNRIEDNEVIDNSRYGMDLSLRTTGNWIEGNLISASGDEGVHIGSGSDLNFLLFNDVENSGAENIYLLDVRHIFLIGNNLSGSGSAAIYMKHAQKSLLLLNSIEDRVLQVRGASHDNAFVLNHLSGAGYVFEAYEETRNRPRVALGWEAPTRNRIIGGSIEKAGTCVRFSGASGNRVEGVAAADCDLSRSASRGSMPASDNYLEFL